VKCVMGSVLALVWSFVLLFGFTLVFAILIVQQLAIFLADRREGGELSSGYVSSVQKNFGSVSAAVLSLFEAISGGTDWADFYDIVKKSGDLNSTIFLVYIFVVWLSVTNIIMSIFIDKAMKLAQPDMDDRLLAKRKGDLQHVRDIKKIFHSMDENQSGTLSVEELRQCMQDVRMASYFDMIGLDIRDAEAFITMLTSMSGSDEVDVHTFVSGWLRLKGPATSLDLCTMQYQTQLSEITVRKELALCRQDIIQLSRKLFPHRCTEGQRHTSVPNNACLGNEKKEMATSMSESTTEEPQAQDGQRFPQLCDEKAKQHEPTQQSTPESHMLQLQKAAPALPASNEQVTAEVVEVRHLLGSSFSQDPAKDTVPHDLSLPGQM